MGLTGREDSFAIARCSESLSLLWRCVFKQMGAELFVDGCGWCCRAKVEGSEHVVFLFASVCSFSMILESDFQHVESPVKSASF